MKLRCFQEGGSEKYLREIARVMLIQGESIDQQHIAE